MKIERSTECQYLFDCFLRNYYIAALYDTIDTLKFNQWNLSNISLFFPCLSIPWIRKRVFVMVNMCVLTFVARDYVLNTCSVYYSQSMTKYNGYLILFHN